MAFNLFVIVAAVLVGAGAGVATVDGFRRRSVFGSVGVGMLAGAGLSAAALVVVVLWAGRDRFAAIHLVYVIVTMGVPLAALIVLVKGDHGSVWLRRAMVGLLLLAPVGLYATHVEPFWLRVDTVQVTVAAAVSADIRVGVLADLQTTAVGEYEHRVVDALIAERPDMVLLPGDLWQMPTAEFEATHQEFAALIATLCDSVPHVFVVEGNTDNAAGLKRITTGTHAVELDNEVVEVTINGTPVRILGLSFQSGSDQISSAHTRFIEPADRLEDEPIRIVLMHQPDRIDDFSNDDPVDLFVAGHTHGGQIAVPFLGPPVTLTSVPRSVASGGLHNLNGHPIYVSTAVGRERGLAPQVRFGVRPSIGILDVATTTD